MASIAEKDPIPKGSIRTLPEINAKIARSGVINSVTKDIDKIISHSLSELKRNLESKTLALVPDEKITIYKTIGDLSSMKTLIFLKREEGEPTLEDWHMSACKAYVEAFKLSPENSPLRDSLLRKIQNQASNMSILNMLEIKDEIERELE